MKVRIKLNWNIVISKAQTVDAKSKIHFANVAHINLILINSTVNAILVLVRTLNSCWQMSGNTAVIITLSLLYHLYLIHFFNEIT